MKILGVTACPSGVAHTYMAAEALKKACEKAGVDYKIETQGSIGIENRIDDEDLKGATAAVLTTDMPIKDEGRFAGIPKVRVKTDVVITSADAIVSKIKKQLG